MKKAVEPVSKTIKDVSQDVTRTKTEVSKENNKSLENFKNKVLEKLHDRGTIASYLLSLLSEITNPEHTSPSKLVKDPESNEVNELVMNKTLPNSLYDNWLTFRETY